MKYLYIYMYKCTNVQGAFLSIYECRYIHTYIHTYIQIQPPPRPHTYAHTNMYTYIYIYTHKHTHTPQQKHYTATPSSRPSPPSTTAAPPRSAFGAFSTLVHIW